MKGEMGEYVFETKRLGFRLWKESDKEPFYIMNSNDQVMKYFPKVLTKKESDEFYNRIQTHFKESGYGLWVVELKDTREFIGFIGFYRATFEAFFTPCIEIGWRLDNKYWNKGYATEGALRCINYGFEQLNLEKIYSFTSRINTPSIKVMEKIGLKKIDEFLHPKIEDSSPLKPHVLYYASRI